MTDLDMDDRKAHILRSFRADRERGWGWWSEHHAGCVAGHGAE